MLSAASPGSWSSVAAASWSIVLAASKREMTKPTQAATARLCCSSSASCVATIDQSDPSGGDSISLSRARSACVVWADEKVGWKKGAD
jgi:hypothetical protein